MIRCDTDATSLRSPLQQHTPFLRGVSFRCRRGVNSGCRLTSSARGCAARCRLLASAAARRQRAQHCRSSRSRSSPHWTQSPAARYRERARGVPSGSGRGRRRRLCTIVCGVRRQCIPYRPTPGRRCPGERRTGYTRCPAAASRRDYPTAPPACCAPAGAGLEFPPADTAQPGRPQPLLSSPHAVQLQ